MGSMREGQETHQVRLQLLRDLERRLADDNASPMVLAAIRELLNEAEAEAPQHVD
jgi:hypothetical protein